MGKVDNLLLQNDGKDCVEAVLACGGGNVTIHYGQLSWLYNNLKRMEQNGTFKPKKEI